MLTKLAGISLLASTSFIRNPTLGRSCFRRFSTFECQTPTASLLGKEMPYFKGTALVKSDPEPFDAREYFRGKYGLLVFYPLDFTFVCPSELLSFSHRLEEFERRNVRVLGVSVDSPFSHKAWKEMDPKSGGLGPLRFPLFSDLDRSVSRSFGLLREEGFSQRASVLLDKNGLVKHVALYDLGLGRSVDETLRLFDAVQFSESTGNVCPANWRSGEDAMKPTFESTKEYLSKKYGR